MNVIQATKQDAAAIHLVMKAAFREYEKALPPSSALDETVLSIRKQLMNGEQALLAQEHQHPIGVVRYTFQSNVLSFFRLSVLPEKRGQGIATLLLNELEAAAIKARIPFLQCKVRVSVPKNMAFYHSLGYIIKEKQTSRGIPIVLMEKPLTHNII
ncbi:hypothetical protein JCM19047_3690 [Bacillus sp. JCM 19047]|nr:hypothetical protein JCM19047_3690 [Bacillus sp. JCM 19047]